MDTITKLKIIDATINSARFLFELNEKIKKSNNKNYSIIYDKIKKYELQKFSEFYFLKALALRKHAKLNEIYYPVEIEEIANKKSEKIKLDKFNFNIFKKSSRILIEDQAGMGKTTLEKFLFISYLESKNDKYIPIFIPLRNLKTNINIENYIMNEFKLKEEYKEDFFNLNFIIFLDGFDEIPSKLKKEITEKLKQFINCNIKNFYILSSRKELLLDSFDSFKKYKINSLNYNEGTKLIETYALIEDMDKEDIEILKNQLFENRKLLNSLLKNPLLASLVYRAYYYGKNIPNNKYNLYEKVFDALYNEHDISSKDGFSRTDELELSSEKLKKLLSVFSLYKIKNLEIEYKNDDIKTDLEKSKKFLGYNCSTEKIIQNLKIQVPIFLENYNTMFWAHKSMLDYFISLGISDSKKRDQIIKNIINSNKLSSYSNIIEFLIEKNGDEILLILLENLNSLTKHLKTKKEKQLLLLGSIFNYTQGKKLKNSDIFFDSNKNYPYISNYYLKNGILSMAYSKNTYKIKIILNILKKYIDISLKHINFNSRHEINVKENLKSVEIKDLTEIWKNKILLFSNIDYSKLEKNYLKFKKWKEKKDKEEEEFFVF